MKLIKYLGNLRKVLPPKKSKEIIITYSVLKLATFLFYD